MKMRIISVAHIALRSAARVSGGGTARCTQLRVRPVSSFGTLPMLRSAWLPYCGFRRKRSPGCRMECLLTILDLPDPASKLLHTSLCLLETKAAPRSTRNASSSARAIIVDVRKVCSFRQSISILVKIANRLLVKCRFSHTRSGCMPYSPYMRQAMDRTCQTIAAQDAPLGE